MCSGSQRFEFCSCRTSQRSLISRDRYSVVAETFCVSTVVKTSFRRTSLSSHSPPIKISQSSDLDRSAGAGGSFRHSFLYLSFHAASAFLVSVIFHDQSSGICELVRESTFHRHVGSHIVGCLSERATRSRCHGAVPQMS